MVFQNRIICAISVLSSMAFPRTFELLATTRLRGTADTTFLGFVIHSLINIGHFVRRIPLEFFEGVIDILHAK